MRTISRLGIMSEPIAPRRTASAATNTSPQRRVMRAAWALHRDHGGTFAASLRSAWRHEKAQSGRSAVSALQGHLVDTAYLFAARDEITSSMPIEDYRFGKTSERKLLTEIIERLINVLDFIDGDADFEPSLCCSGAHAEERPSPMSLWPSTISGDDIEDDIADNEEDYRQHAKREIIDLPVAYVR